MTLGPGGNIYEVARRLNRRPTDIINLNRFTDGRLNAKMKDAGWHSTNGRIAC